MLSCVLESRSIAQGAVVSDGPSIRYHHTMVLETILAVCLGLGLAAACGFRIFVPMLVASLAAKAEWVTLADGFDWIGTWPAVITFAVATALEIGGYYFPWLDNLLDAVATPAAAVAGVLVTAAFIADMHPLLAWSVAVIAGGGVAGTIKTGLVSLRVGSTATTAGVANPLLTTFEWVASLGMSLLAMVLPVLAAILALLTAAVLLRFACRLFRMFLRGGKGSVASSGE